MVEGCSPNRQISLSPSGCKVKNLTVGLARYSSLIDRLVRAAYNGKRLQRSAQKYASPRRLPAHDPHSRLLWQFSEFVVKSDTSKGAVIILKDLTGWKDVR